MAAMAAAIFRSIFTVIENRRPPGGPHRRSRPSHPHHDRPGANKATPRAEFAANCGSRLHQIADSAPLSAVEWAAVTKRRSASSGLLPRDQMRAWVSAAKAVGCVPVGVLGWTG